MMLFPSVVPRSACTPNPPVLTQSVTGYLEQFIADHLLVTRFALKRHWQRAWSSLSAVSC